MAVKEIKEELKKIDPKGLAGLIILSIILGIIYGFFINNFVLAIIAMTIAVFGSYFVLSSFEKEDKPLTLLPGERLVLSTLDMGYIMFPGKKGGFLTKNSERDLSIQLTNKRIVARKSSGETILEVPLQAITAVLTEKKVMAKYLRITYMEKDAEKQALLFVGNTELWTQRLGELGVKSADEYDTPEPVQKETYKEDTTTLQSLVDKGGKKE